MSLSSVCLCYPFVTLFSVCHPLSQSYSLSLSPSLSHTHTPTLSHKQTYPAILNTAIYQAQVSPESTFPGTPSLCLSALDSIQFKWALLAWQLFCIVKAEYLNSSFTYRIQRYGRYTGYASEIDKPVHVRRAVPLVPLTYRTLEAGEQTCRNRCYEHFYIYPSEGESAPQSQPHLSYSEHLYFVLLATTILFVCFFFLWLDVRWKFTLVTSGLRSCI